MKKYTLLLVILLVAAVAYAVPAHRMQKKVKQSDGTELTVVLAGDEALHFYTTLDGKPLVKEINGDYSYAMFSSEGKFVSTQCLAHDKNVRTVVENAFVESIDYEMMSASLSKAANARSAKFKAAAQKAGSQIVPEGDVNVAVLLVQFKDTKFTYTKEDFNNILNTKDYVYENPIANSIGSARDYFMAQSDGKFRPNFIVTDIVTLDNNMSYYGGNDSNGEDKKPTYAIKEGIKKADAAGFDFSKCDNNGDGEVEFVYCIYAGYSENYGADASTIWPHQWQLSAQSGTITVDGVKCDTYACSGELIYNESYESRIGKTLAGIGVMCHEFSHCLGLHDIYDTTYDSGNWGMDYWDLMDQGSYAAEGYVPVGYSAYQRDFCGWRKLVEIDSRGSYSMEALTQGGVGYKIVNDANNNEYYILENRKQEGWDTYLFGSGMLVIHVDYLKSAWDNNRINVTTNHPRYTLIPADNELLAYNNNANAFTASLKGDVWPGTSGNTELTNTSIPAAKVYAGGYMNKPITNIKYQDGVISFNFMYGIFAGAPTVQQATDITSTSFVANWSAVENATEYIVELYKEVGAADGAGDKEVILDEDFMNCAVANTELNDDIIDSYMSSTGWECKNVYSENGALRIGSSKNPGVLFTPWLEASGNVVTTMDALLYNSGKDTGVVLTIEYYDEDNEMIASEDFSVTGTNQKVSSAADVDGEFYVAICTHNSTGNNRVNIDNLNITKETSVKRNLVTRVTTSATSYGFNNLDEGAKYLYRVKASDGDASSDFSDYMEVALLPTSIDDVLAVAAAVEVYSISGVKVYSGNAVPELSKGVYVVVTASGARKIVIE